LQGEKQKLLCCSVKSQRSFTKRVTENNPHTFAYLVTGHGGDPRSGENNDFQAISAKEHEFNNYSTINTTKIHP
jgi:hypothetical protein